jgi:hypothetical protein
LSNPRSKDHWLIDIAIGLTNGSRLFAWLSIPLTLLAVIANFTATLSTISSIVLNIAIALGFVSAYLALRIELDHRLFVALGQSEILSLSTLNTLDTALNELGWKTTQARDLVSRVRGVKRLIQYAAVLCATQAILIVLAATL